MSPTWRWPVSSRKMVGILTKGLSLQIECDLNKFFFLIFSFITMTTSTSTFQSRKRLYTHKCPLVCLSVTKTPQQLEIIILHHSFFILQHSSFILHHHSSFIHPSSSFIILHHPSSSFVILHHPSSSFFILHSSFLNF